MVQDKSWLLSFVKKIFPRLFTELRYSQGIINLTDEPLSNNIIPRVKTSGFKLLVGIEFPLKKSSK